MHRFIHKARSRELDGKYTDALRVYRQAHAHVQSMATNIQNSFSLISFEIMVLRQMGACHGRLKQYEKSRRVLKTALKLLQESQPSNKVDIGSTHLLLGSILRESPSKKHQSASAKHIALSSGDTRHAAVAFRLKLKLNALTEAQDGREMKKAALEMLAKRDLDPAYLEEEPYALSVLASGTMFLREFDDTLVHCHRFVKVASEREKEKAGAGVVAENWWVCVLQNIVQINCMKGNKAEASKYFWMLYKRSPAKAMFLDTKFMLRARGFINFP